MVMFDEWRQSGMINEQLVLLRYRWFAKGKKTGDQTRSDTTEDVNHCKQRLDCFYNYTRKGWIDSPSSPLTASLSFDSRVTIGVVA